MCAVAHPVVGGAGAGEVLGGENAVLHAPVGGAGPGGRQGTPQVACVEISYDGGRTWRTVTVHTDAEGKRHVSLTHPAKAATVSFKATLADTEGNTYTGTIHHAYRTVR